MHPDIVEAYDIRFVVHAGRLTNPPPRSSLLQQKSKKKMNTLQRKVWWLCLLVMCATTQGSRVGSLRVASVSDTQIVSSDQEARRSLIQEDVEMCVHYWQSLSNPMLTKYSPFSIYRQLFGFQLSSGEASTSDLSMAPLSMSAPLSMARLSATESQFSDTKSTSRNSSNHQDSSSSNDATTKDPAWHVGVATAGTMASVALIALVYRMLRPRSVWKSDDASFSSLPTTIYFGNGNCGTF